MVLDIRQPSKLLPELRIFYSWQSDLPAQTNKNFIRKALAAAHARVQKDLPDEATTSFVIDSAVEGRSGSPDIANTIFEKIAQSHIVVADVSVVARGKDNAALPNPNVSVETGFAASKLGWHRLILVSNLAYGEVEDLPFDIRGRRITVYRLSETDDRASAHQQLVNGLCDALKAILEDMDHGPSNDKDLSPAQLERQRDLEMLRRVLISLNTNVIQLFVEYALTGQSYGTLSSTGKTSELLSTRSTSISMTESLKRSSRIFAVSGNLASMRGATSSGQGQVPHSSF